MLLALSGVTGIGKSYFKEKLVEELNFHKVSTIRTRPIRVGEKNGVDGIFIETHFDPANAKSDGANMLHLDYFEALMTKLVAIRKTINTF